MTALTLTGSSWFIVPVRNNTRLANLGDFAAILCCVIAAWLDEGAPE